MGSRGAPHSGWSDARLVKACLDGEERAWHALVDKYKNLVYAVVRKYRPSPEEAADLFQSIWLAVYNDLPKLRKQSALRSWLISLASHQCFHWKRKNTRLRRHEAVPFDAADHAAAEEPAFVEALERDQLVREAVFTLPERCREMIRLLFFTLPPVPYKEVAERLGLATGSIGFIRGRCLERLRRRLERHGLS